MMFPDLKEIDLKKLESMVGNQHIAFEHKYDGTAAIIESSNIVTIHGRGITKDGRQDYTNTFPELTNTVVDMIDGGLLPEEFKLRGEIVIWDSQKEDFKTLQSRMNRKIDIGKFAEDHPVRFLAFDCLSMDGSDHRSKPFAERREILTSILDADPHNLDAMLCVLDQATNAETKALYIEHLDNEGWEGIVAKDLRSIYKEGEFKYKPRLTQDVFWEGDFIPGKNRNAGKVGSLVCYQYISGIKTCIGNVSGLSDEKRNYFTKIAPTVNQDSPIVLEVQTHEILASDKFRYPNFLRIRTDKSAEQCARQSINNKPKETTILDWM